MTRIGGTGRSHGWDATAGAGAGASGASPATSGTKLHGDFAGYGTFADVLAGKRTLSVGERGPHVRVLEEALVKLGYALPRGAAPDEKLTRGTQGALARFQRDQGIAASGDLDGPTLTALDGAASKRAAPAHRGRLGAHEKAGVLLGESGLPGGIDPKDVARSKVGRRSLPDAVETYVKEVEKAEYIPYDPMDAFWDSGRRGTPPEHDRFTYSLVAAEKVAFRGELIGYRVTFESSASGDRESVVFDAKGKRLESLLSGYEI